ncbi:hypothetical protein QJS66_20800 [Kocuria rhizophila]|nr:hypothetical protein QJS66_20800 [Kocuria rhizophila]
MRADACTSTADGETPGGPRRRRRSMGTRPPARTDRGEPHAATIDTHIKPDGAPIAETILLPVTRCAPVHRGDVPRGRRAVQLRAQHARLHRHLQRP